MAKRTMEELLGQAFVPVGDELYEVPKNWIWTKLGNIATFSQGIQVPVNKQSIEKRDNNIRFIRIIDYTQQTEEFRYIDSPTRGNSYVDISDIVMVRYGASAGLVVCGIKGVIANNMFKISTDYRIVLKDYIKVYLKSPQIYETLNTSGGSSAMPAINFKLVSNLNVPLPSLPEQRRIVMKIETLFSKIENAKELIEESREGFENRTAAILAKAFSGELTKKWRQENPDVDLKELSIGGIDKEHLDKFSRLPRTWRWIQVKDVIEKMKTKKPSSLDKKFFHYIDIESIDNKNQQIRQMKIVDVNKAPSRASRYVEKDDVLISLVRPYLKNIALVEYDQDDIIASTGFYVCKTKSIYEPKLFYYYLKTDGFTNVLTSLMRGDNSPSVRISEFPQQLIPYIPIEEQKEIVRILDRLLSFESEIEELTELEDQIELLKKSVLAKAFRGELGTNDPTEDSAIELLKEALIEKTK